MKRPINFLLVLSLALLASCSRSNSDSTEMHALVADGKYRGGLYKVWVNLADPVADEDQVRWKTGRADIAQRGVLRDENGLIIVDTVYLAWEKLPVPEVRLDSVKVDSTTWRVDSTYVYRDTLAVVVDGQETAPMIVELLNILPRIDTLIVGGVAQDGDSVLVLAAHPGDLLEIEIPFSDAFNTKYRPQVEWPEIGGLVSKLQDDSLWKWEWAVPNRNYMDTTLQLRIYDTGGYGDRLYDLHLVIYTEFASAWVASGNSLVKYSPEGAEVARIEDSLSEVSDLVLNSNAHKLWVLDRAANALHYYDTFGKKIFEDDQTFETPLSIAVDVESGYLWVSDIVDLSATTLQSRVGRYALSGGALVEVGTSYVLDGPIRGLSIDQFERDLVWFVSPESDFVGYIRDGAAQARVFSNSATYGFNRPTMVSFDPKVGVAWIADSSRVLAIDTAGHVRASVVGFGFANSVSAAGGVCWVTDVQNGLVYRFDGNMTGTNIKASGGLSGFLAPTSISAYARDGGAWVADQGAGRVVRLDANGVWTASGSGLEMPNIVKVHQVVE